MKNILIIVLLWSSYLSTSFADGYQGLSYELGQYFKDQNDPNLKKVSKYSGAMGTATNKHRPLAIYSGQSNKTFFTYGGLDPSSNENMAIYVGCYDHHVKALCNKPTLITTKEKVVDQHDNASLLIDENNYIWVYVSGRNTKRLGEVYKSNEAGDISEFTKQSLTVKGEILEGYDFSYPQPWLTLTNNKVLLHTRYTNGRELYIKHEDKESVKMVKGGHYAISYVKGDRIVMAYNSHDTLDTNDNHPDKRTNLYFMQSFDGGLTWQNKNGDALEILSGAKQPLEKFDIDTQIKSYRSTGIYVYLKDIKINEDDDVLILYSISKTADPTNFDYKRTLHLVTIPVLGSPNSKPIGGSSYEVNHNYSSGFIDSLTNSIYIPSSDTVKNLAGGNIQRLTTTGSDFISNITSGSRHHNYVRDVFNKTHSSALDFSFFWTSSDPLASDQRVPLHYYGTKSNYVYNMPLAMPSNPRKPTAILRGDDDIKVLWEPVENTAYYFPEVSINNGAWAWIYEDKISGKVSGNEVLYKDQKIASYQYRVKACNSYNECSSFSSPSGTVTVPPPIPSAPSAPSANLSHGNTITIHWGSVANTSYYTREVSINGGSWINPRNFTETKAIYINQKVRSYRYRVKACNSNGQCSSFSLPSGTVKVSPQMPFAPSAPLANLSDGNTITIHWNSVANASYYTREVSINGGSWINPRNFTGTKAVYINQKVRSYRYRVKACNINDECSIFSSPSNLVTVK
jgi:hypothetical protein